MTMFCPVVGVLLRRSSTAEGIFSPIRGSNPPRGAASSPKCFVDAVVFKGLMARAEKFFPPGFTDFSATLTSPAEIISTR